MTAQAPGPMRQWAEDACECIDIDREPGCFDGIPLQVALDFADIHDEADARKDAERVAAVVLLFKGMVHLGDNPDRAIVADFREWREDVQRFLGDRATAIEAIQRTDEALRQAREALRDAREVIGQMMPVHADHAPVEGAPDWVQCSEHEAGHLVDDCPQDLDDDDEVWGIPFVDIKEAAAVADAAIAAIEAVQG